jgi:2EXR family
MSSCSTPPISTPHLKTFPLFPLLPTELRLKIFRHITALTSSRILKLSYLPAKSQYNEYISNVPPPITLSISHESRLQSLLSYTYISLGSSPSHSLKIPIDFSTDILYISLSPIILATHLHTFLYHLSTSASRHSIRFLAIDLRIWNELCENGFLGVLGRMKGLKTLDLVVEFGRCFEGELGFLEAPEWRSDLRWVAERAGRDLGEERERARGKMGMDGVGDVRVRCVILTRGGEQA